jgi:hypothetical protein
LATLTVVNNSDSGTGSLRAAITAASAGDTITFASSGLTDTAGTGQAQTIKLTNGSLVPTVNLTITDAGMPAVSIVSTSSRIFDFPLSSPASLTAVTLQGLTVNGTANDGTTGGAIHIATISAFSLTIDSCNITGTLGGPGAATRGGAISVTGLYDSLIVTNCAIKGTVTTVNTVSNNDAGALYVATNKTVSVSNSTLTGSVTGSTTSNEAGAVYQNAGTLTLTYCTLSGSSAGRGGGFYQQGGTSTLTNCTISGNSATTNGGGVYLGKGTLNLIDCTIANNTAGSNGGGVAAPFRSSNGTGGTATATLTNCTISGNTAASASALYTQYIKPTTGINPTGKVVVNLNNTIVSGGVVRKIGANTTDNNEQINATDSLFDTTPTTGAGMTVNGTNTSNLFGMNPMLGTLQNNGGTTQTLALLAGSPAIDAGSNALASSLTTDQRGTGYNRVINNVVDIGAFEYQPPGTTISVSSSLNPVQAGLSVVFTATVAANAAGSNALQGTVTFSVDGVTQTTVSLSNGIASFTTSNLSAGQHAVTAAYSGFTATGYSFSSSMASMSQTVTALPTPAPPPPAPPATLIPPPAVGIAFASVTNLNGQEVIVIFSSSGVLTQSDATGVHQLATGVRSAGVAFGPTGEVLIVVFQNGQLFQFDTAGTHLLANGVVSAAVAFTAGGTQEVLEVVFANGILFQFDPSGTHQLASGARSASVAFGPNGEVLDLVYQSGQLVQFDSAGTHLLSNQVTSAAVALNQVGAEVLDVIFADNSLWQFDVTGGHKLAASV